MNGLPILARIGAFLALCAALFGAGYYVGHRVELAAWQAEKLVQMTASAKALQDMTDVRDQLATVLSTSNDKHLAELQEKQHETNMLRDRINTGTWGLRVNAKCPNTATQGTTSASLDTEPTAELTKNARSAYFALRDGIDQTIGQLTACQAELKERTKP